MTTKNYPKQASDSIVLTGSHEDLKVLLIKRKNDPYRGLWAFPGGFIEKEEEAYFAAKRELLEETGLDLKELIGLPLTKRKKKGRDPRGEVESFPFLFYKADLEKMGVRGMDDALEAKWVPLRNIEELAFDHGAILCEALGFFWGGFFGKEDGKELEKVALPFFLEKGRSLLKNLNERVVFFGGSFNPWHRGHQACLDLCVADNVIVVPDTNPFKVKGFNYQVCFWKAFKKMALEMEETSYGFFPGFFGREEVNPTAGWFINVPFYEKGLLVGDDSFFQLETWSDSENLLASVSYIYVAPRNHSQQELEIEGARLKVSFPHIGIFILSDHDYQKESSTTLRKKTRGAF